MARIPIFWVVSHEMQEICGRGLKARMKFSAWLVFIAAALLEVGGDAVIRRGLRSRCVSWILIGCATLALYGLVVNSVKWDFSKLVGVYIGFFAVVSVLCGRFVFREDVPTTTWFGLALIVVGGLVIQLGRR
jgi:small multidrug resistance family-3 protein